MTILYIYIISMLGTLPSSIPSLAGPVPSSWTRAVAPSCSRGSSAKPTTAANAPRCWGTRHRSGSEKAKISVVFFVSEKCRLLSWGNDGTWKFLAGKNIENMYKILVYSGIYMDLWLWFLIGYTWLPLKGDFFIGKIHWNMILIWWIWG